MNRSYTYVIRFVFALALLLAASVASSSDEALPSWSDGAAKAAILDFVSRVTQEEGLDFVPPAERIATFDNDGTLWSEQPLYFQFAFALYRVKVLAPKHPEWKDQQPFKAVLEGDKKALAVSGAKGLGQIVMATHAGMTTEQFATAVADWVENAKHPRFQRPYTELVFQPMLELLDYLRDNGFKTYIVSGGDVAFMRVWAEKVYGIPPEQVVGTTLVTQFQIKDGHPVIMRLPKLDFNDDKAGKPVAIDKYIGRRPIFAFGNSDGDQQMLEWTAAGKGVRFMGLVHHTDAEREWAYDRKSKIGTLDKAWDEATAKAWTVVDMKQDWKVIYPFEK